MKRIKDLFNLYKDAINDNSRQLRERVFLIYSIISVIAVTIALIGDYFMSENSAEMITLIVIIVTVSVVTTTCLVLDKLGFAINLLATSLIFFILPALFFFGGGIKGGGFLWIIFAFMYIGLLLTGAIRKILITLCFLVSVACFLIQYYYPDLVYTHTRAMFFVDTFISLIMVGLICFIMTWFQNKLFIEENDRAKAEKERAEELTRSQNRFFSSMSHEIRTPINSILGLNELILRDQTTSDEVVKDATGIQGAGKMLLAIINDILDFSKIEAGSMDIVPVDYRVGDLFSEVVNMVWMRASEKGLDLKVNIDPAVPSVLYGDEVRIKQIIVNLLNNAVKYTKEGSVELHVESSEAGDDNVLLTISVIDTGMGIKKEALPHLFDAFKRVDEEKNRNIEGTGLGLSIVKLLVDLMGGTVTVNSVYGEGSTFTVVLKQGVSNNEAIGELSIHDQSTVKRSVYESGFTAPEAAVLIVDDNEMNLEVECKLLAGTQMTIDKAMSGKEALEMTQNKRYDTILMDHLMPEMDGIECFEAIRNQTGGLNRVTPIIVLTANAGSENRDLYNRVGFDDYLVKPVSGDALENILIKHIAQEKIILGSRMMSMRGDIKTSAGYSGKIPVMITSSSMCDLPDAIIKKLRIPIIPFVIRTEEGAFKDGQQMDADELLRYLGTGRDAVSAPPGEEVYTEFFARNLKHAHHLIHISLTTSMSVEYSVASEAAKSFDNVTVINSGVLSSATGILVLIAHKLAQQNIPVEEIISELETVRERLKCSFVIDTTSYMADRGYINEHVHKLAQNLNLHPCLKIDSDKSGIGGVWMGKSKRVYKKYISKALPVDIIPDQDIVFITYADIPVDTLNWIRDEISKVAYFEHVIFKQASAAISSNCGPGAFGILYFVKSNKSYNLASYFNYLNEQDETEETVPEASEQPEEGVKKTDPVPTAVQETSEGRWYDGLEGIDARAAIVNSGSEDAFKTVLKIFYDSISAKSSEIGKMYSDSDWSNYTIKVHALKSSAKLIGALGLSEEAQLLENAGKENDTDYIASHHPEFMEAYLKYRDILAPLFEETVHDADSRPLADETVLKQFYSGLSDAAADLDCDTIEEILADIDGYSLSEEDKEKISSIREMSDNFDYDGIAALLSE